MSFKSILNNERIVDSQVFDYVYNNHLFESSGHPLFTDESPEEFIDILYSITQVVETINKKLKKTPIERMVNFSLTNSVTKTESREFHGFVYKPISIALNKLGFKDVINAQHSNLKVNVYNIVEDNITEEDLDFINSTGNGYFTHQSEQVVINGKFRNVSKDPNIMGIECFAINGRIVMHSFMHVFLHEFLHFYESYNRTTAGDDNLLGYIRQPRFSNILKREAHNFNFTEEEVNALWIIFYRLFNGEDNALVGSLFGSMISYDVTTLAQFEDIKNKLWGFKEYNYLKNAIKVVEDIEPEQLYNFFKRFPGFFKGVTQTDNGLEKIDKRIFARPMESVKREFLSIVEKKVNKVYKKLMKFASRYLYMMKSFDDKHINAAISD